MATIVKEDLKKLIIAQSLKQLLEYVFYRNRFVDTVTNFNVIDLFNYKLIAFHYEFFNIYESQNT